jgi:DNA processing protein
MFSPTSIDNLVENTGVSVEVISSMLLILELQGYLEATAGGCYVRIK